MNPVSWVEDKYKSFTYFVKTKYNKSIFGRFTNRMNERYEAGLGENRRAAGQYFIAGVFTAGVALSSGFGISTAIIGYAVVARGVPIISSYIESGIKRLRADAAVNDFIRKNPQYKEYKNEVVKLHKSLLENHLTRDGIRTFSNILGVNGNFNGKTLQDLKEAVRFLGEYNIHDAERRIRDFNIKLMESEKGEMSWKNFGKRLTVEERVDMIKDWQEKHGINLQDNENSDIKQDKSDVKIEPFKKEQKSSKISLKPKLNDNNKERDNVEHEL